MDDQSKNRLEAILREVPASLSEGDREFVRARQSYLTADERKALAEVLNPKVEAPKAEEEKPKKK